MFPQNELIVSRRIRRAAIFAAIAFGAILLIGSGIRFVEAEQLKSWTREAQIPTVSTISPVAGDKGAALSLPATLQAWSDARIYSRVPGYVKAWYKDIGAPVKQGELLAVIDTPELDQQIAQARADLDSAISAEKMSDATARRWNRLLTLDAVSKQDTEEKDQDYAAKIGATKAARANLDRLLATKRFARISAPFDGVITRRTADIGQLVSSSSTGEALFAVADMHAIRVYVNIPQSYSARIGSDMTASMTVPEYPNKLFLAKLIAMSNAVSSQNGSLQMQFEAQNPDGLLKPGAFAQVTMLLPGSSGSLQLPASALMFRAAGLEVATVDRAGLVKMKAIQIGTDLGSHVIVASGLSQHDQVIDNPPDSLASGDHVRVRHAQ